MKKTNSNKQIVVKGTINKHQWGMVVFRGGCYPTESAGQQERGQPTLTIRKYGKENKH